MKTPIQAETKNDSLETEQQADNETTETRDHRCFTIRNPWWSPDGVNHNRLHRDDLIALEKRIGPRMWEAVFFIRDSITNPILTILGNDTGKEIIEVLSLYKNRKEFEQDK